MTFKKIMPYILTSLMPHGAFSNTTTIHQEIQNDKEKQNYTIVIDKEQFNLQENAKITHINELDTMTYYTNHIGMAYFKAQPEDRIIIQPTSKSEQFENLEKKLGNQTFQVLSVKTKN
ncbi:MAG: hypothetical protein ACLFN8_01590 [Candidatus Woesearchaeota archaeon]